MPQLFAYDTRLLFDHSFYQELFTSAPIQRMDDLLRKLAAIKTSSSHCKLDQGQLGKTQNYMLTSELKKLEKIYPKKFPEPAITHGLGTDAYEASFLSWVTEDYARNLKFAQIITSVSPHRCSLLTSEAYKQKYQTHKFYRDDSIQFRLENSVQIYSGKDAYNLIDVYHAKYMDSITP